MIKIQGYLPRKLYIACSGGVDSMAVADFLKRSHVVALLYFNHGTEHSEKTQGFIEQYADSNRLNLFTKKIDKEKPKSMSLEEFWREQRYAFLRLFDDAPVITGHHLDDCVETWVWSSLHGEGKLIPYHNGNIIRPFRMTRKVTFVEWCQRHDVSWVEDDSNMDTKYIRNFIRHKMMPDILTVNPGIHKVIMKKIMADINSKETENNNAGYRMETQS